MLLPPGEETKDLDHFGRLAEEILAVGIERGTMLVALGGGVVGDVTGFAAATLLRGIDFVQIPTTLLAQVDSSVGGKTGINTRSGKNLIGAFYQPRLVLADTGTLASLPRRELRAGYAEIVKYGLIRDAEFFAWLEAEGAAVCDLASEALRRAVMTSCAMKAEIVAGDEREEGDRALLNFGHTFGHALEAETGFSYRLLHGEAVALGMVLAFDFAARLGLVAADDGLRVRRHLADKGLPTQLAQLGLNRAPTDRLIAHMSKDKKVRDGRITLIMPRRIGEAFVMTDAPVDQLRELPRRSGLKSALATILVRREGRQRQRVNTGRKLFGQRLIDEPLPGYAALTGKSSRHDGDSKMGLTTRPSAFVPDVAM